VTIASDINTSMTPESLAIIKRGVAAMKRLDRDKNVEDWIQVGNAFLECRNVAMREAKKNTPFGPKYTAAYARLLKHYKLADMLKDKSDRARLIDMIENLPAVMEWRQSLSPDERRRYTHPTTIMRHYHAAQRRAAKQAAEADGSDADAFRAPSVKQQLREARAEVHRIRKESAVAPWAPGDAAPDRARAVMEIFQLSVSETEELGLALVQHAKAIRDEAERKRED
jgi:hypothetical protein